MAKKISIVLDSTEQEMLLTALYEKAYSCPLHSIARSGYKRLYGDFKDAIAEGEEVSEI